MIHHRIGELPQTEIIPGYKARFVHSDEMTQVHWEIEAGSALAEHSHANEQIAVVVEGEFVFVVEEEAGPREIRVRAGECVHLPSNLPHSGRTATGAVILDCFSPPSETTGVDQR